MRRLLAALLVILPAAAQEEPKPPSDGVVLGRVVNSRGEPLAGAWVTLEGFTTVTRIRSDTPGDRPQRISRGAASDAAGRVRFDNLPNGNYNLQARMAGRQFLGHRGNHAWLQGPKAEAEIEIELPRKPVLTGRVFDSAGVPLVHSRVEAYRRTFHEGQEVLMRTDSASTDDRGMYRIALREPGRYWLKASHTERSFPRGSAPRTTGVAFYPNAPDLLTAAPIEVAFDQEERTLDINLPSAPATYLTVALATGPAGKPCVQCRYSLRKVDGAFEYEIISGGTGPRPGFDYAGIPPGQYRIYVEDHAQNQGWWAIAEAFVPEGRPAEVLVATQPPIPLSGRVVIEEPPSEFSAAESMVGVNLETIGARTFFGGGRGPAEVHLENGDTEFAIGPLSPGRYRPRVWAMNAVAYLAGVSRQGRPLPSPVMDLSQPGAWDGLELHLRFDTAEVQFEIAKTAKETDETVQHRIAVAPAADNPFGTHHDAVCGPNAFCSLSGVPPGRYQCVAVEAAAANQINFHDPAVWQKLGSWVRTVTLAPGENPKMALTPAPVSALR